MLIRRLQATWTNVGPKEGVNLKKNVAQISTNAKLLKEKQQCIHNPVIKQWKKSTRNNKRERKRKKEGFKNNVIGIKQILTSLRK